MCWLMAQRVKILQLRRCLVRFRKPLPIPPIHEQCILYLYQIDVLFWKLYAYFEFKETASGNVGF